MGLLTKKIEDVATGTVERWLDERIPAIFDQIMRKESASGQVMTGKLKPVQFVWQMAFEFMRADLSMSAVDARDMATDTLKDFLRDEKIRFGHPDYDWSQSGAVSLARECEIEYWEAAA